MKKYTMRMSCKNCGHQFIKEFEKEQPCNGLHICPNCDCRQANATIKAKSYEFN